MPDKPKVLILAGGTSGERVVSLNSGRAVAESLQRSGYEVRAIDTAGGMSLIGDDGKFLPHTILDSKDFEKASGNDSLILNRAIDNKELENIDLVFIALHGGSGEDGTIQAVLDLAGIPYTGSGMLASALAMNKGMTKKMAKSEGVDTPRWNILQKGKIEGKENPVDDILSEFNMPFIVKPNNSGSTVGLTIVKTMEQLNPALNLAFQEGVQVLVEDYIKGREITCAVLEGRPYPLVEIVPGNELYDYEAKYTKGKSQYFCPADIDSDAARLITENSVKLYHLIGCSGLVRADFILDQENHPWFLEVNTIPGMTELSLAPMAARAVGIGFDELIDEICKTALEKGKKE